VKLVNPATEEVLGTESTVDGAVAGQRLVEPPDVRKVVWTGLVVPADGAGAGRPGPAVESVRCRR
jgi:hypothetical protein